MSELITTRAGTNIRLHLLATVSALSLLAVVTSQVKAEDADRPTVWIEVGGQLDRLSGGQQSFAPPFLSTLLENPFTPPSEVQTPPRYSFGEEGRLSFNPEGSDWVFSASVRYGKANSSGNSHEETVPASANGVESIPYYNIHLTLPVPPVTRRFATTTSQEHASNLVVDFQAGKDVGMGAFGMNGASTINAGVRIAQFTSQSKARIDTDPNFTNAFTTINGLGPHQSGYIKFPNPTWDLYVGKLTASRSFRGVGPSFAWNADATLVGNPDSGAITLDWGLIGSVLFGRQKMAASHETMAHHATGNHGGSALPTRYPTAIHNTARSRSVVVPNAGGFAGLSLRFPNAKVSMGYRIDAFFGAMDGGIDTRKTDDHNFYGPFATISVGLGG